MLIKRIRICIGIPCFQSCDFQVLEDYMRFAYHLGRRCPEHDFLLAVKGKSEQFRARNAIVKAALQQNCDYLLMLDDDHIIDISQSTVPTSTYDFLRDMVFSMEQCGNIGVLGALYYQRGGDVLPVIMHEHPDGTPYFYHPMEVTGGMQQVAVTGGGCTLIRMSVFDKIDEPWFAPEHEFGTDIQLCKQVRKAGWEVWCDTGIVIGHLRMEREIIAPDNRDRLAVI